MENSTLVIYELWEEEDGYSFFVKENQSARNLLTPDAKFLLTLEAHTWEDANRQKEIFLGWR